MRMIALGVAVLVSAFAVVLASQVGSDPRAESSVSQLLGDPAPAFTVETFDGNAFTNADLAGRAVIVNFWNSWCVPCQEELPALKAFYARHANEPDFIMLGIVRSDSEHRARNAARHDGMDWTLALDPDADAALAFGTRGQPETFAITPDGQIVASLLLPARVKDLETMLAAARRPR
jgi:cytochrome c biogenesis protein CcmG/thiol:disulfide interchange protein DsbE